MAPMKVFVQPALALLIATTLATGIADAQPVDAEVTLNLFTNGWYGASCQGFEENHYTRCDDVENHPVPPEANMMFLWVIVSREGGFPNGIGGLQFGIEYDGPATMHWNLCTSGAEIPQGGWPESGAGNAVTWEGGCHNPPGENARVGHFILYGELTGTLRLTADPRGGQAVWADCTPNSYEICPGNLAVIDIEEHAFPLCGDNCGATPIRVRSWSRIKSHYRSGT